MDVAKLLGMPLNASSHGARVDSMMLLIHVIMLVLFVGWGLFFVYCLVRFRKKANPKADYLGVTNHRSTWIEGAVALAEAIILIALAFPIWSDLKAKPPTEQEAGVVVDVVAQQFAWNIHYPGADGVFGRRDINLVNDDNVLGLDRNSPGGADDIMSINQLNLPVNKQVLMKLTSQDVIHSIFLPPMRVKQDAIPGMEIPVYFTPTMTGNWEIACAQLCGLGHYRMRGFLNVQSDADYEQWLRENAPGYEEEAEADEGASDASAEPAEGEGAPADTAVAEPQGAASTH
jgi:cytochrome c oxidase subunit 2